MSNNNAKQFRVYPEDHEKIAGFMAENDIGSNSEFMHFVAENLSKIGATPPTDGGVSESKPKTFRVYPEDYEKIAGFMTERDIGSNPEFMHFIAENLSRIGAAPTDGDMSESDETEVWVHPEDYKKIQECMIENNISSDIELMHLVAENLPAFLKKYPAAGDTENLRQGAVSPDGSTGNTNGVFIHGKFYPTLFPDESWAPEDRSYYFNWIYDNIRQGLYYDLVNSFNGVRVWKTDHEGNPKEKTPYGYFTNKYLQWHTWPVYPELWPNLPKQKVLDRKSTRLNSSHPTTSRMPSSA